jgi:hypothetical protein
MVEGVNGGALRGTSAPAWSTTPDDGIDEVDVTGRAGTCGGATAGADFDVCFLLAFSDWRASSADGAIRGFDLSAEGCGLGFAGFADFPVLSAESGL